MIGEKLNKALIRRYEEAFARVQEIISRYASGDPRGLGLEYDEAEAKSEVLSHLIHRNILSDLTRLQQELTQMLQQGPYGFPRHPLHNRERFLRCHKVNVRQLLTEFCGVVAA